MVGPLENVGRYAELVMERINSGKRILQENKKAKHVFCFEKFLNYLPKKVKLSNTAASEKGLLICYVPKIQYSLWYK